jgi:hypothetical protein
MVCKTAGLHTVINKTAGLYTIIYKATGSYIVIREAAGSGIAVFSLFFEPAGRPQRRGYNALICIYRRNPIIASVLYLIKFLFSK